MPWRNLDIDHLIMADFLARADDTRGKHPSNPDLGVTTNEPGGRSGPADCGHRSSARGRAGKQSPTIAPD
jgi:hypothetical protein